MTNMDITQNKCSLNTLLNKNLQKLHWNKAKWLYVQEDVENASKIWHWNGIKSNNTTSYMLLDHCYAFGLLL